MTLFRKVFQNQSREATEADAPDQEDLRSSFKAAQEVSDEPLALDPFAVAEASDESTTTSEDHEPVDHEVDLTALGRVLNPESEVSSEEASVEEDSTEMSSDGFMSRLGGDAFQTEKTDAQPGQPDAQAPMWQKPSEDADEMAHADAHDGAAVAEEDHIAGLIERAQESSNEPQSDTSDEDHDVADHTLQEEAEPAQDAGPEDHGTEAPEAAPKPDLAAFAREQMAAAEGLTAQPSGQVQGASELRDAKTLDLSKVNVAGAAVGPAAGRAGRRAGRVKTRLLGFNRGGDDANDPFGETVEATAAPQHEKFPVGWLVVVEGPGVGHSFSIFTGASMIGRGEDQMIKLDFGDNSISRQNHAAVAYDEEQNKFYIGHGGKSNIIRRNARPVLSTEELNHADLIRIGETTLRFVALCGSDFKWDITDSDDAAAV